ncbi:MAG: adenylate/guanylate cyclase domain-containing protein [Actinomycetota bacterium]
MGVSLLPIAVFAILSYQESRLAGRHEEEAAGGHAEEPRGEEASGEMDELFGIPITTIELGVAGISLALSILAGLYIARTIVRPIRELESSMNKVEEGDLEAKAPVRSADELGRLAASFNKMVEGVRREAFVRDLFGQYVTPELAKEAIEHEGKLEGQLVTSTILFSDIRNFTGVSEELPASQLVEMLNRYFTRMADRIVEHKGLVNKFGGDSVLAMFGTPLNPNTDHAAQAVQAALAMCRSLEEFNADQETNYLPKIMIGIGIATGDVVAGNVGSIRKLEYTVIGDAVNVASRLQTMTKETGRTILANAETARAAPDAARYVEIGEVDVRGRTRKSRVFSVEEMVRVENAVTPDKNGPPVEGQAIV